ncbi:hypothetical protein GS399_05560 [Pedobacter sp. HMF7647]|uniref:Uncharacterized protein n=1 Tax=Hufsiella arboris TaxID=2695275 RepID=A0A7K1Y787_9SPHI|nr:hypothetical protein [Hufsiella arboris]MXV50433.1 hypothetical protein [Hufsiella arboris]
MNENNLENLKKEMGALGFSAGLIKQMEAQMKKDVPEFKLYGHTEASRGQVDLALYFKRSNKSDYYYLNKFEASHNQSHNLKEGHAYMMITPAEGSNVVKKLGNLTEAVEYFRDQKGTHELAAGKDASDKITLARMENGKVTEVDKDFRRAFYAPPVAQNFWLERGKGFSVEQAANMVQGRAVYREDMLNLSGKPYEAWTQLDKEQGKDQHGQLSVTRYTEAYGFQLAEVLDKYAIRELGDPGHRERLETSLKNGNRPMVTSMQEGQEVKLFIEAVPRFKQLNFFAENGKMEKREQFLKESSQSLGASRSKGQAEEVTQRSGLKI